MTERKPGFLKRVGVVVAMASLPLVWVVSVTPLLYHTAFANITDVNDRFMFSAFMSTLLIMSIVPLTLILFTEVVHPIYRHLRKHKAVTGD